MIHHLASVLLLMTGPMFAQQSDTVFKYVKRPLHRGVARAVEEVSVHLQPQSTDKSIRSNVEVAVGKGGSMLVLVWSPSTRPITLSLYDSTGRFVRDVAASAPIEPDSHPEAVAALHDGRWILFDGWNRITVLSTVGDYVETWRTDRYKVTHGAPDLLRVDSSGRITIQINLERGAPAPNQPDGPMRHAVVRLGSGGEMEDFELEPNLPNLFVGVSKILPAASKIGSIVKSRPYTPFAFSRYSPLGYYVTGISDRYAIDLRLPRQHANDLTGRMAWLPGDPVLSIRVDAPRIAVSERERADQKAYIENLLARTPGTQYGVVPDPPAFKPYYKFIRVADDGRIWVNVYAKSERYKPIDRHDDVVPAIQWREPQLWDVFEPDGVYIGRIQLPDEARILKLKGDKIWAVVGDNVGNDYLKRFRAFPGP